MKSGKGSDGAAFLGAKLSGTVKLEEPREEPRDSKQQAARLCQPHQMVA